MATQQDILNNMTDTELLENILEKLNETRAEVKSLSRALQVKGSLVNHNPTIDSVLDACSRIQWRWSQPTSNQEVQ